MAEKINYPKFHSFFHRDDTSPQEMIKCPQCGKEITEFKNCVCPQCGAYIGKEMYQENEVLVERVISGYVESFQEHSDGLITDEVFEERMKALEQVARIVKESSKELENHHKNQFETTDKLGKFQNSLLYRFTYGFYSLVYTLARPTSKGYHGVEPGYSVVYGIFGALILYGSFNAKGVGAVLLALLGLVFLLVPMVAIVERILGNKPNENEFLKRWTAWKSAIHSRLWVYFSKKTYQEKDLGEYYVYGLEDLIEWQKDSTTHKPFDEDDFRLMKAAFGLIGYQFVLIKDDYLVSKGEESAEVIDKAKRKWRELYEQYEA